jgi:uracil-DNA glycosylase
MPLAQFFSRGHATVIASEDDQAASGSSPCVAECLRRFRAEGPRGWTSLPFFAEGAADVLAARLDARLVQGLRILPAPEDIFNALRLTPPERVKAVILGQDPYPTPGDAHGLAFSYRGGRRLPASLRVILDELVSDIGLPARPRGDLTRWAAQGVLLLNTALTTEAGAAGAHLAWGWAALADEVLAFLSANRPPVAFLLWGAPARRRGILIDRTRHLVIESGHPSPLNRARDFVGSRPFSATNAWLESRGITPVDWRLG